MSYSNIKKAAKAAVQSALFASDSGFGSDFLGIQCVKEFDNNTTVESRRILIGANATPVIIGSAQRGWTVNAIIEVRSNFSKWSSDDHEDMCSRVEALMVVSDLATRLSNASFVCQVATPGESSDDFQDEERITEYNLELECYLTGV